MSTMHRFYTDHPDEFMQRTGWQTLDKSSLGQVMTRMLYPKEDNSYWFTASRKP